MQNEVEERKMKNDNQTERSNIFFGDICLMASNFIGTLHHKFIKQKINKYGI